MRKTTSALAGTLLAFALAGCHRSDDAEEAAAAAAAASDATADTASMASDTPTTGPAVAPTSLVIAGSGDNTYLADTSGRAVYVLEGDDAGTRCTGNCTQTWTRVVGPTPTSGAADVQAPLIATVTGPDGTAQWTYAGHPLYYFTGDTAPGMYVGQGVSDEWGTWYLVRPSGQLMPASFTSSASDAMGSDNASLGTTSDVGGSTSPTAAGDTARELPTQDAGAKPEEAQPKKGY